jgi:hypothetical protein
MKTVDISCHYSTASGDVIPPETEIILTGNELQPDFFQGKVAVSFETVDESDIQDTMVQYSVSDPSGTSTQSPWLSYDDPMIFDETGSYLVSYYSTDTAGNVENMKAKAFEIRM